MGWGTGWPPRACGAACYAFIMRSVAPGATSSARTLSRQGHAERAAGALLRGHVRSGHHPAALDGPESEEPGGGARPVGAAAAHLGEVRKPASPAHPAPPLPAAAATSLPLQVLPGEPQQLAASFDDRDAAMARGLRLEGRRYEVRLRLPHPAGLAHWAGGRAARWPHLCPCLPPQCRCTAITRR